MDLSGSEYRPSLFYCHPQCVEKISSNKIILQLPCPFDILTHGTNICPLQTQRIIYPCRLLQHSPRFISKSTMRIYHRAYPLKDDCPVLKNIFFNCFLSLWPDQHLWFTTGIHRLPFINPCFFEIAFAVTFIVAVIIKHFQWAWKQKQLPLSPPCAAGPSIVTNPAKVNPFSASSTE